MMNEEVKDRRAAALGELQVALEELESGEGLARFVGGHGIQSRTFEFSWSDPAREMDFRLPYMRVLGGEEQMESDNATIGAAIRVAMMLLMAEPESERIARVKVVCDDRSTVYQIFSSDGSLVDSGVGLDSLLSLVDTFQTPDNLESMTIIMP